ncbi:MAG: hypothetical protein JW845_02890, partial [Dehalococcoidales bacterium]|nr:hypothetical protein [Dehalococcoidales bacterium]
NLVPADFAVSDAEGPIYFTLIDYASIYQDEEITFSTFDELFSKTDEGKISYAIIGWGSFITGYSRWANTSSIRKEYVGYDITCVDAEIQFGQPPANGVVAIGRFDPQATGEALSQQGEWPSWAVAAYTTEDYHGVTIHSWGSGLEFHLENRLIPPHIDELGRAKPLAVTDKYLFYAASVETVRQMIDASQNQYSSLADLPEYAAIADGLSNLKAYVAIISEGSQANVGLYINVNPQYKDKPIYLSNYVEPLLKNYLTFGSGLGRDAKGTYMAVVLYHENHDDALENFSLLEQRIKNLSSLIDYNPWSEKITNVDIEVEGNMLLAKLYTDSLSLWASWIYTYDNLLFHEE